MLFDSLNYYEITPQYFNYLISINHHYGLFFSEWRISIDLFGLIIQFAGLVIGFLSYLVLDTRFFFKNIKYLTIFCIFDVVVLLFTTTNNVIYFFILWVIIITIFFISLLYKSSKTCNSGCVVLCYLNTNGFFFSFMCYSLFNKYNKYVYLFGIKIF